MTQATLTPDALRRVGEALWGDKWQAALAAAWTVNDRTVRSWASGRLVFPAARIADLRDLAQQRGADIAAIAPLLSP